MLKTKPTKTSCMTALMSLLFVVMTAFAGAQHYNFQIYDDRDGLPQAQVLSVMQDSRGYMWFGTHSGVARYNGNSFEIFDTTSGLASNSILALAEGVDGNIYLGTHGGGLSIFDGTSMKTLGIADGLPSERINDILIQDDSIWLAAGGGLVKFENDKLTVYRTQEEYGARNYTTLFDDGEALWVGTDIGAFRFENGQFQAVDIDDALFDPQANFFLDDGSGGLMIGTNSGLFHLRHGEAEHIHISELSDLARFVSASHHPAGDIWFGTDIGALRLRDGEFTVLLYENGLPDTTINDIFVDAEANTWFGTNGGLAKLRPGAFVYFDTESGLAGRGAVDIFEDSRGRIWICSGKGGIAAFENGQSLMLTEEDGLPNPYVYGVGEAADGNIIIGTRDSICTWDGNVVRILRDNTAVTSIFTDRDGRVWIGSLGGTLVYENGEVSRPFAEIMEADPSVYCINQSPGGDLWFGTRSMGVYVFDGEEIVFHDANDGLTNLDVWSIDFDPDGVAWIGTNGAGVFRHDGESFTRLSVDDGLSNNYVWQVLADRDGSLWLGTNEGVDHFKDSEFRLYTVDDGLAANEGAVNAVLQDSRGRRWFGSNLGASLFVGEPTTEFVFDPPVIVESLSVNEITYDASEELQLHSGQNNVHIQFTALSFRNEHAVLYSHKLEGLEEDWSEPSPHRFVNYTNLSPRRYVFKVRALYRKQWSPDIASISFTVNQPFYRSIWFLLFVLVVIIASIGIAVQRRTAAIEKEKVELDLKVRERTKELIQANAELETFNVAVTNNLKVPLRHIEGYCELILQSEGEQLAPKTRDLVKRIDRSTQRTNQMINDLMRLSLAGSLEMKPAELDLSLFARVTARELQKEEPDRSVQFRIEEDIHALGSERLLWMVLENLLSNAWKATRDREDAVIEFGMEIVQGERRYYVKDNGIGLDEHMLEKLFRPFALLHHPDEFPGSGLGLVTARRIIVRHHGRIWAESAGDTGSTFYFTLNTEKG